MCDIINIKSKNWEITSTKYQHTEVKKCQRKTEKALQIEQSRNTVIIGHKTQTDDKQNKKQSRNTVIIGHKTQTDDKQNKKQNTEH